MMSRLKKILVTGSIAYDVLLGCDGSFPDGIDPSSLDTLSVSFLAQRFARHHGGTGANIAWNLALLRQDPMLVGTVGGMDGGAYLALLEERGISIEHVDTVPGAATATAIIASDSREHQIIFFHPGADAKGSWPKLDDVREDLACGIVSPRDVGLMLKASAWMSSMRIPCIFDPGQQVTALSADDLRRALHGCKGVMVNAYEWSLLSEKIGASMDDLLSMTEFVVVTLGEEGLKIHERGKKAAVIPACKADVVLNPTGAGDALRAGFLAGIAAGWPLLQCGQLGASVASFVVEQEGTMLDRLDMDAVMERGREAYGEMLPALF